MHSDTNKVPRKEGRFRQFRYGFANISTCSNDDPGSRDTRCPPQTRRVFLIAAYLQFRDALRGSDQTSSIVLPKSTADTSRYLWLEAGTRFPHRVLAIRKAKVLALPPEMTTVSTLKGGASRCIVSLIIYFNFFKPLACRRRTLCAFLRYLGRFRYLFVYSQEPTAFSHPSTTRWIF